MNGIAQMHFGPTHLKKMSLLLPNSMEQQIEFSKLSEQLDKSKFELEQALSELTLTYKRILAENLG